MTADRPQRPTIRRARIRRRRVAGLLVFAVAAVSCEQLLAASSSTGPPAVRVPDGEHRRPRGEHRAVPGEPRVAPGRPGGAVPGAGAKAGALDEADGAVPDGTTVFDDGLPGVANLDPALLGALRRAATDAASDGVVFLVDSGWRSPRYQQRLLDEALSKYGSEAEAARWVATPGRSAHVSGDAVDIGPSVATSWLSQHGAEYGLCQIYGNEPWHYELRPHAGVQGCPSTYADPTQDPRLQP